MHAAVSFSINQKANWAKKDLNDTNSRLYVVLEGIARISAYLYYIEKGTPISGDMLKQYGVSDLPYLMIEANSLMRGPHI